MKLTPKLIRHLHTAAQEYNDKPFFGIRSCDHEFFVFNWALGLRFLSGEIMNCPHVEALERETDLICMKDEDKKEIIQHMYRRSWMDILTGCGLQQEAKLVRLREDEHYIFSERGLRVIPFETDNGRRYYVREGYFDIAEEVIGDAIAPVIFRPINSRDYPREYRPMLFQDGQGEVRGLVYAISEENMRNPVDRTIEYKRIVEDSMPELFIR